MEDLPLIRILLVPNKSQRVEDLLLREMLDRNAELKKAERAWRKLPDEIITPVSGLSEISDRCRMHSKLSTSTRIRVMLRFLDETNPDLN